MSDQFNPHLDSEFAPHFGDSEPEVGAPELLSAEIRGNSLRLRTSEPVEIGAGGSGGFVLDSPEVSRTNLVANNSNVGAVAPSTIPTGWTGDLVIGGLTQEIVGLGTIDGMPYMDIRVYGTTTEAQTSFLNFGSSTGSIAATTGTAIAHSAYLAIVGGATAPLLELRLSTREFNVSSSFLRYSWTTMMALTATLTRVSVLSTMGADTTKFTPCIRIRTGPAASGDVIDVTIRIAGIQAEAAASPTDVILTTAGAVTVTIGGALATDGEPSGVGTDLLVYPLDRTPDIAEVITLDYTQPGDGVEDVEGNDMASFSDFPITLAAAAAVIPLRSFQRLRLHSQIAI